MKIVAFEIIRPRTGVPDAIAPGVGAGQHLDAARRGAGEKPDPDTLARLRVTL